MPVFLSWEVAVFLLCFAVPFSMKGLLALIAHYSIVTI